MTSFSVDVLIKLHKFKYGKFTDQVSGWHLAQNTVKGRKWRNYTEVKKDHESERREISRGKRRERDMVSTETDRRDFAVKSYATGCCHGNVKEGGGDRLNVGSVFTQCSDNARYPQCERRREKTLQ